MHPQAPGRASAEGETLQVGEGPHHMYESFVLQHNVNLTDKSDCTALDMGYRTTSHDDDVVVVVQGDEPLVYPEMIDIAVKPLIEDQEVQLLTLIANANETEWNDPNEVKVTIDTNDDVLMMSRSPIPSNIGSRNLLTLC